jgi:hypothetical protein
MSGQKLLTQTSFFTINLRGNRMVEDPEKDGKFMNTLSFKGTGLKT